ncbi:DUF5667 domain-containing protein [Nocardioides iriomotensis]|uniref:DUF5667 domain-containing protein n=1 Tax=Nocardioides iriomotensis TaxID=715784 RepID=A0A4Q5JAT6_9ACTN|nr:DUF5667 domain-containing protein [Nocardioides iriomotensis]RYU14905.1 hypothetical protein ETU37_02720 [Nocardioides iriomotensis]
MTALFSARRRADELASALDNPHRDVDAELRELVGVVGTLRRAVDDDPFATPRADFAADLRARLMAEAVDVLEPGSPLVLPPRPVGRRERRLVAAAAAVLLVGGTAGMAAASSGALPGDALYPVKRGIERAEAGLSVSKAGKGRDLLAQASGRLTEVRGLLAADRLGGEPRVPLALDDFVAQSQQGAALLMDSFRDDRDPARVADVRTFTADALDDLADLATTAPASVQPDLRNAALALRDIDVRAGQLCDTCAAGTPTLDLPPVFLAAAEADRALDGVDAGALDNSHPFVVPKSLVPAGRGDDGKKPAAGDDGGGGTGDAGDTGVPLPGTPSLPGGGGSGGGGGGGTGGGDVTSPGGALQDTVDGVGGTLDDTVGSITDGLTGVVETVLPDPTTGGSTGGLLP